MAYLRTDYAAIKPMKLLPRLRKKLQDNLSLSTRLFLKIIWADSVRALSALSGGAKYLRSARPPDVPQGPPSGTPADLVSAARRLADEITRVHYDESVVKTSIIIPVFNKAAFTLECLRSLIREVELKEAEVIVVDDASTDETLLVLAELPTMVRVVQATQNLGFGEACNLGATVARGKYLVFLNNDTAVLSGWLRPLIETIEGDATVGAVGSMLMYVDGSIQEAGGVIWRDGQAYHYGWGESPDDYRFNFAREVDYCSAASLLIRKDVFDQLRGFDSLFAPAYYEDVDLCFGVRSLGYKVIYQPMSRLVHYESVTLRAHVNTSIVQMQTNNRAKFVAKWATVLEREHLPQNPKDIIRASNRKRDCKCVIVFDERVPSPDRDAGSLRMLIILKTLARCCHVIFVPFNRPQSIDYERALWKEGIETANAVDYRRLIKRRNARVAILIRPTMAEVFSRRIRRANPQTRIIFDTVDIGFIRLQREYRLTGDKKAAAAARHYKKLETRLAKSCDQVWCVTAEDQKALAREAPQARFAIIPTIHPLQDRGKSFAERQGLLFIGNYLHRPNLDAIHYFMREIYPLVRKAIPEIKVSIVGDNTPPKFESYASEHVTIAGYVPDVDPIFRTSRIFIAPLRFGSGMKGKIGQALSYGLPVVTTSVGAEGMELENEHNVLIADDVNGFAESVIRLYQDAALWQRLSDNGCRHIASNFTPEIVEAKIRSALEAVGGIKAAAD
jgi:GT2 family glycosyltransferase